MYQLVSAPLTGVSQPEGWAQVVSHPLQQLVCVVSLQGPSAHQLGRDLTEHLLNLQVQSALGLHQFTQKLVEQCQAAGLSVQFAAQLLTENTSIICTYQGCVYLRRDGKIGLILPIQSVVQIVEGKTHENDIYVLGTAAAGKYEESLQKILQTARDPDAFVTQLMQVALQASDSSLVAAAYVHVKTAPDTQPVVSAVGGGSNTTAEATDVVSPTKSSAISTATVAAAPAPQILARIGLTVQKLSQTTLGILQPLLSRDVYVRRQGTKKVVRLVISVLVIIVGILVVFGVMRMQQAKQIQVAQAIIQPAETELGQIKQVATTQPLEARQRTEALIALLQGKSSELANQKTAQNAVSKELTSVKNYYQTISGQQELNVLPTFFDLRLFQSDFLANRMDIQQNNLFFLDPDKKQILALDTGTKQTTLLPLGTLPSLKDFSVTDKSVYLLGGGVSVFTLGTNATPTLLKNPDLDTEPATIIRSYGSYVYLLNPDKRNIFRYALTDNTQLSSPAAWLRPEEKFDLTTVESMAIDGDVWVSTKTGGIQRFTTGKANTIAITGLKDAFSSPIKIFTKDGLANVYILEPAKNRLVIIKKDGTFLKEITSSTLASASDVVADETQRVAFILSGSLVYQVQF